MGGESIRLPMLLRIENEKGYDLQRKLYQKAKQEPEFRFYSLYVKNGLEEVISELNVVLKGWKAYFNQSTRQKEFRDLDFYIAGRFYRLGKKLSQRRSKLFKRGVYATLRRQGLYSLSGGSPVNA